MTALVFAGCPGSQSSAPARGSADGTLAISADGALLFAVNPDAPKLAVIDTATNNVVASLDVGNNPSRVMVGPGDNVFVSNRGSRSVSVFKRGASNTFSQMALISTGAEPIGMGISADGQTLFVACSAQGSVQAFDLGAPGGKPSALWEAQLDDLPRTVAVLPDGRVYVGHLLSAVVDVLDPTSGARVNSLSSQVGVDPTLTVVGGVAPGSSPSLTFRPTALESILIAPDGARAYLFHRRDLNGIISANGSPINSTTPVVTPAITTVELNGDNVLDETLTTRRDFPPAIVFPDNRINSAARGGGPQPEFGGPVGSPPIGGTSGGGGGGGSYGGSVSFLGIDGAGWTQGPAAAVEDAQGNFLFVANRNTNNVTVLPTNRRTGSDAPGGLVHVIGVHDGPSGLALSPDNKTLYVHNQLADSISVIQGVQPTETALIAVGSPVPQTVTNTAAGRTLFFSAANSAMTNVGAGLACESCHVDGSHDGNVWQFSQGPRKTPSLIARHIKETFPYHWDGTELDFNAFFAETVQIRMGGSGVSSDQRDELIAFMEGLAPIDNPNLQAGGGLTASQLRGQQIFNSAAAQCSGCHVGPNLTDNNFHDVGTRVVTNPNGNPDDPCLLNPLLGPCTELNPDGSQASANPLNVGGFNTPSLHGVAWAAPYLHDGSAATLLDRVSDDRGGKHGNTSQLTADQKDDLVAYLKTL